MSPLNRGPLMGPRMSPVGMRPPPPRFGRLPMPGMPSRMPPPPHSIGAMFGPMRPRMPPPRLGGIMRPVGPPPLFGARNRGLPPLMLPMMRPRMGPRGPLMRPGPRRILPPQVLPHMRPRFPPNNANIKGKTMNNSKKVSKLEELELRKPWMTDEIRSEIQKKNKLYAKAKKTNKDSKEWEEFRDLRNKVTRMIRDAKNEYLAKNPESVALYKDEPEYIDERDENNAESEDDDTFYYCEMCDREFFTEKLLKDHNESHKVCGIDGCTFTAHPKLIDKHISMQHNTGLYRKLKNLSTPEEISKWIEERKRKYPTKTCIERNNAEVLEKQQRGEVIKGNKTNATSNQIKSHTQTKNRKAKRTRTLKGRRMDVENVTEMYRGVRPFTGTKNLDIEEADDENISIDPHKDDDKILQTRVVPSQISDDEDEQLSIVTPVTVFKSIGGLVADYDSDMDNDEPEEIPAKKIKTSVESFTLAADKENEFTISNDLLNNPNEVQTNKINSNVENDSKSRNNISKRAVNALLSTTQHKQSPKKNNRQQKRQMLLERLLSRSIVHERNFICQCIKYIENNDFFSSL